MITDSEKMAMDEGRQRDAARKAKPGATQGRLSTSKMSKGQLDLYWSLWFRVCRAKGWEPYDETVRHNTVSSLLETSGGEAKGFSAFSQPDFTVIKFAFTELAAGRTVTVEQLKKVRVDAHRQNLKHVILPMIERYGSREAMTLLRERFHVVLIEELDTREIDGPMGLEKIRETLVARTYKPKN